MLFRIYLVYKALISSTIFCSTRASRIGRIYSSKTDFIFGIKSLFNTNPLSLLLVLFVSLSMTFAQMLRISEGEVSEQLAIFGNSLWCILITMGTVGYGDYFPITHLGRVVVFLAAISGIIISSLLILSLSSYLSMSSH